MIVNKINNKSIIMQINKNADEIFNLLKEYEKHPIDDSIKNIFTIRITENKQLIISLYFGHDSRKEIWIEVTGNTIKMDNELFIQFIPKLSDIFIKSIFQNCIIGILFVLISIKVYPILLLISIPIFFNLLCNVFSNIDEQWIVIKKRLIEMIGNIG